MPYILKLFSTVSSVIQLYIFFFAFLPVNVLSMNLKTLSAIILINTFLINELQAQPSLVRYLTSDFEKTERPEDRTFMLLLQWNGKLWQGIASDEFGNKRFVGSYKDSGACVKEGPFIIYYAGGVKWIAGEYKDDLATGTWKRYSPEGNVLTRIDFREGKFEGSFQKFYLDGVLMETSYYHNNQLDSVCMRYHHNGSLAQHYVYQHDSIISRACFLESGAVANCDDYKQRPPVLTGPLQYNPRRYFQVKRSDWKKLPDSHIILFFVINFDGALSYYGLYKVKRKIPAAQFLDYASGVFPMLEPVINLDLIDEMKRRIYELPKCIPAYQNNLAIPVLACMEINILDN